MFSIRQLTKLHPKMNRVIKNTLYTVTGALEFKLYPMTLEMKIFCTCSSPNYHERYVCGYYQVFSRETDVYSVIIHYQLVLS